MTAPTDPEREAFEKWAGSRFKFTNPGPTYRYQYGKFEGEYFYAHVCAAWDAWHARSTLTPSPVSREPVADNHEYSDNWLLEQARKAQATLDSLPPNLRSLMYMASAHLPRQPLAHEGISEGRPEKADTGDALDANRYRWLRDSNKRMHYTTDFGKAYGRDESVDLIQIEVVLPPGEPLWLPDGHFDYAKELDRSIDAAMPKDTGDAK